LNQPQKIRKAGKGVSNENQNIKPNASKRVKNATKLSDCLERQTIDEGRGSDVQRPQFGRNISKNFLHKKETTEGKHSHSIEGKLEEKADTWM